MKHILEYEDDELKDLLGDLSSLGLENPKGTVIFWTSEYDVPRIEVIISSYPEEGLALYLKNGFFGPDFISMLGNKYGDMKKSTLIDFIKKNDKIDPVVSNWFSFMEKSGRGSKKVSRWFSVTGLVPKQGVKSPQYIQYVNVFNPYHVMENLRSLFTNIDQKLESTGPKPRISRESDSIDW